MNLAAFMLYGSFRPLGSRELEGSCSSAVVVRSKRAFSVQRIHRSTQCLTAGTAGLLRREADRLQQRIDCLAAIGAPCGSTSLRLMHAAGADIPHSATSRRGMLPALAGLAVGLAYAAISVYWAVGGRWLLTTVGISLSQPGQAGHLAALLAVWGAAAVKAVAAVLPLLAIGVWPRTANGGLRRLARVLAWIEAAILTGYGLVLTASGLLVQAGVIKAAAHADRPALEWHAYLWDPWFLIWGIFVFLALWRSRPASQDHLPGRAPADATAPRRRASRAGRARPWRG